MNKLRAFTVIESMVTLVVASLMLLALFGIYDRAKKISNSITTKIDSTLLPGDICQRIAEDIDRIAPPGSGAKLELVNSYANGLPTAKLRIYRDFLDKKKKTQILEEAIWQATYDMTAKRLVLWRCHAGIIWEDRLLDEDERRDWSSDRHVFVPVCSGLSMFRIQVPQYTPISATNTSSAANRPSLAMSARYRRTAAVAEANAARLVGPDEMAQEITYLDTWNQANLPPAITVTLSCADPFEDGEGGLDVEDDQKTIRTVVLDRTKTVKFSYTPLAESKSTADANDPNKSDPNSVKKSNSANASGNTNSSNSRSGTSSRSAR